MEIDAFIDSGEKIVWKGEPETNVYFNILDIAYIPFSILFLMFTINDFVLDGFDPLGVPFIIIGLYLLVGRSFIKNIKKKTTLYCVTNERVIVFNKKKSQIVIEKTLRTIKTIICDGIIINLPFYIARI